MPLDTNRVNTEARSSQVNSQIIKNDSLCTNCLLCTKDCISGVWETIDHTAVMTHPEFCNRCSHCLAICPKDAITHRALDASQVTPVHIDKNGPETYEHIVRNRRSMRHYTDEQVDKDTIQRLIYLARYSPTASNDQNVSYIVVQDAPLIRKISRRMFSYMLKLDGFFNTTMGRIVRKYIGAKFTKYLDAMSYYKRETEQGRDLVFHGAQTLVLFLAPKRASFAEANCNIAATNFVNLASSMGLGTCFIGFIVLAIKWDNHIRRWLKIPKDKRVYASVVLGHPALSHKKTTSRKKAPVTWINA